MCASAVNERVIVADIGGTNARFAIAGAPGATLEHIKGFKDVRFRSFEDSLAAYLGDLSETPPRALAVGAAGPVIRGAIHLTNLAWTIDASQIAARFGLKVAVLANDLVAMAAGIALAQAEEFLLLPGSAPDSVRRTLVIAIGTGLGVAWYERENKRIVIHSTEAGHMRFAPTSNGGTRLLQMLLEERDAVSFENIISGSGIKRVYAALRHAPDPELGSSEQIFTGAESGANATAQEALSLVTAALSTFARNLVLVLGGVDEIIFAGGLGRRLRSALATEGFLRALRDSRDLPLDLSHISARVALDDTLPLKGAAHLAFGLADCAQGYREGEA